SGPKSSSEAGLSNESSTGVVKPFGGRNRVGKRTESPFADWSYLGGGETDRLHLAGRVLGEPLPIGIGGPRADALLSEPFGDWNFEDRRGPLVQFGMSVGKREAAVPGVVGARDVGENWRAIVHLQITILEAAHVFFAKNEGLAWTRAIEDFANFDIGKGGVVVLPGGGVDVEVAHLAVH